VLPKRTKENGNYVHLDIKDSHDNAASHFTARMISSNEVKKLKMKELSIKFNFFYHDNYLPSIVYYF